MRYWGPAVEAARSWPPWSKGWKAAARNPAGYLGCRRPQGGKRTWCPPSES
ncbi:MAG: hypothetical protein QXO86_07485 [Nitrososphaerota archaeon]